MTELEAIKRRAEAASPGPWGSAYSMVARSRVVSSEAETLAVISYSDDGLDEQNAVFIDTPPAIPSAIARAESLPTPDLKRRKRWFGKGRRTQGSVK